MFPSFSLAHQKKIPQDDRASQEGMALIVSLILLLMMSIAMVALIQRAGTEIDRSTKWETSQASFSAAETGLQEGQRWLKTQFSAGVPIAKNQAASTTCPLGGTVDCCNKRLNLPAAFPPGNPTPLAHEEKARLQQMGISGPAPDMAYQFYVAPVDLVSGTRIGTGRGGNVGVGRGHQGGGVRSVSYYRVWSCGWNATSGTWHILPDSSVRMLEITVSKNN